MADGKRASDKKDGESEKLKERDEMWPNVGGGGAAVWSLELQVELDDACQSVSHPPPNIEH